MLEAAARVVSSYCLPQAQDCNACSYGIYHFIGDYGQVGRKKKVEISALLTMEHFVSQLPIEMETLSELCKLNR